MRAATQALNGLIGAGVPQDWATHMLGHELTAMHGLDHAQTLAIILLPALWNENETLNAQNSCNMLNAEYHRFCPTTSVLSAIAATRRFLNRWACALPVCPITVWMAALFRRYWLNLRRMDAQILGENQILRWMSACRICEAARWVALFSPSDFVSPFRPDLSHLVSPDQPGEPLKEEQYHANPTIIRFARMAT